MSNENDLIGSPSEQPPFHWRIHWDVTHWLFLRRGCTHCHPCLKCSSFLFALSSKALYHMYRSSSFLLAKEQNSNLRVNREAQQLVLYGKCWCFLMHLLNLSLMSEAWVNILCNTYCSYTVCNDNKRWVLYKHVNRNDDIQYNIFLWTSLSKYVHIYKNILLCLHINILKCLKWSLMRHLSAPHKISNVSNATDLFN